MGDKNQFCLPWNTAVKRAEYDLEEARRLYIFEGHSAGAAAKAVGCAPVTIQKAATVYGWKDIKAVLKSYKHELRAAMDKELNHQILIREAENLDPDDPSIRADRVLSRLEAKIVEELDKAEMDASRLKQMTDAFKTMAAAKSHDIERTDKKAPKGLRQMPGDPENDEASDPVLDDVARIRAEVGGFNISHTPQGRTQEKPLTEEERKRAAYEAELMQRTAEHDATLLAGVPDVSAGTEGA